MDPRTPSWHATKRNYCVFSYFRKLFSVYLLVIVKLRSCWQKKEEKRNREEGETEREQCPCAGLLWRKNEREEEKKAWGRKEKKKCDGLLAIRKYVRLLFIYCSSLYKKRASCQAAVFICLDTFHRLYGFLSLYSFFYLFIHFFLNFSSQVNHLLRRSIIPLGPIWSWGNKRIAHLKKTRNE
jgi:hypothetical protein